MAEKSPAILFVCLGNICRSPLAEGIFRNRAAKAGLDLVIDSAGTGDWNIGKAPDPRAQAVARKHGLDIADMRARQVTADDFHRFTDIIAMDASNLSNLKAMQPQDGRAQLSLLLDHVPGRAGEAVADPYYGDDSGFDVTWAEVSEAVNALIAHYQRG